MKCEKCGNTSSEHSKFCMYCGNDMSKQQTINNQNMNQSQSIGGEQQNINQSQPMNQYQNMYQQQPMNQYQNNMVQPPRQVSKTGTIIILVLCILSFNILGIILCAVSLSNLSKANNLPEGPEKESKIKTGKTCRTVALVAYIVCLLITIISVIASVGTLFGAVKDTFNNGEITITDGDGNVVEWDEEDNSDKNEGSSNNSSTNNSTSKTKTVLSAIATSSNIVTSGNGLYKETDKFGDVIYRYRSTGETGDVNNYIKFNNEVWRILSIAEDGTMKLVSNDINWYYDSASGEWKYKGIQFDKQGVRDIAGTYCEGSTNKGLSDFKATNGCGLWVATSGTIDKTSIKTVTKNSSLYDYLNSGEYWTNTLSSTAKQMMVKGDWYYGPGTSVNMYDNKVSAYVGLVNVDEVVGTRVNYKKWLTDKEITWLINMYRNFKTSFGTSETGQLQLFDVKMFTINMASSVAIGNVMAIQKDGSPLAIGSMSSTGSNAIMPVVYISNKVKVTSGTGTSSDPYTIEL